MRERINPKQGERNRGDGITVSWRPTSNRANCMLVVTLGRTMCDRIGLQKGLRVIVERDRLAGKLYLRTDAVEGWRPAWKEGCCCVNVPLDDVRTDRKPAQAVPCEVVDGEVVLRLPPWACPPVKIDTARRAA